MKIGIDVNSLSPTTTVGLYMIAFVAYLVFPVIGLIERPKLVIIMPLILCLIGITIGYKDIGKYLNWKGGTRKNLVIALNCFIVSNLVIMIIFKIFGNGNVQNLRQFNVSVEVLPFWLFNFTLVGIGEELFKLMLFLSIFTYIMKTGIDKGGGGIVIAVAAASTLFGAMHVNYNPEMGSVITLGFGLWACVYFYFLFKYKTIVPLMIAHTFQDFSVYCRLAQGSSVLKIMVQCINSIILIYLTVIIGMFLGNLCGKMINKCIHKTR